MLIKQNTISNQELVKQIDLFREQEGNRTELRHDNLLNIIRDEFEEEISLLKIKEREYNNSIGQIYPMFVLTISKQNKYCLEKANLSEKQ
jgi:hypothetical protein